MTGRFTTFSQRRGCCGHIHRSFEAALKCVERDCIEMSKLSQSKTFFGEAFSDRFVCRIESEGKIALVIRGRLFNASPWPDEALTSRLSERYRTASAPEGTAQDDGFD